MLDAVPHPDRLPNAQDLSHRCSIDMSHIYCKHFPEDINSVSRPFGRVVNFNPNGLHVESPNKSAE